MVRHCLGRGTRRGLLRAAAALSVLSLATIAYAEPPTPQTRPWRVAVAGGWGLGYVGLLSLHGLPRERLTGEELSDLGRLKQFDVVITAATHSHPTALAALEQFAAEGGLAIIEGPPAPSPAAIAGRRLTPDSAPNIVFVPSSSPLSRGLPELGVIYTAAYGAGAVIPDPDSRAVVLARYTNEGTPEKYRNHLFDGGQGAPAVLQVPYGKGQIIYTGPPLSIQFSLAGRKLEPLIYGALDLFSGGQLRSRFAPEALDAAQLVTALPEAPAPPPYRVPSGKAAALPKGFQELESAAELQDFCLTGALMPNRPARLLVGYWSPGEKAEFLFADGKLTVTRSRGGKVVGKLTASYTQRDGRLLLLRRANLLTLQIGSQTVLSRCFGLPLQGSLACQDLKDAAYQPLAPVEFEDDFMRESGESGEWEAKSGEWKLAASEGTPQQGANPFYYQGSSAETAVALTGEDFWTDYSAAASVQVKGQSAGLLAGYQGPDDYLLLRLVMNAGGPQVGKLQLVQRSGGKEQTLEGPVAVTAADWQRLELRTSAGWAQCLLNGQVRLEGQKSLGLVRGRVGLLSQGGLANFDDVQVRPWVANSLPADLAPERLWACTGGWSASSGPRLDGSGATGARVLLPWPAVDGCRAEASLALDGADAAGLLVGADDRRAVAVTLVRSGPGLRLRCEHLGAYPELLYDQPAPGRPGQYSRLAARCLRNRLQVLLNGTLRVDVLDPHSRPGTVGLYARGSRPARFSALRAWQEAAGEHLVDEPMPSFAGIIDRHSWAGRSGAWSPDPAHLNCLWHLGYFPGEVDLRVGVHPNSAAQTTTRLYLAPLHQPERGYALTARHTWNAPTVDLSVSLKGKYLGTGSAAMTPGKPYALSLRRLGKRLLVSLNGAPALACSDVEVRSACDSLAVDNGGELLHAEDIAVSSDLVRDYTFETAPTDWTVESGEWKLSSRWSCTPGWAWLGGVNTEGPAMIATRQSYPGDQQIVTYMGAKMLPGQERLTDLHLVCCADRSSADSGYHFVVGGQVNTVTQLLRNGKLVADSPYRLSQGAIHNDWLRLTLRRRGKTVGLWAWDTPVLKWDDPEPLRGGRVAVGTFKNGVMVPRLTVFGSRPSEQSLVVPEVK